jgi:hypothetical protein
MKNLEQINPHIVWNSIHDEDRLALWKQLRTNISKLDIKDKLEQIARFCFSMPIGARSLDYYDPTNWPTPWEILFHGSFCTSSISLLMFHTLALSETAESIELLLVEDEDGIYLVPLVDYQFVLNYELGQVNMFSDISVNLNVLQKYSQEQIKSIK